MLDRTCSGLACATYIPSQRMLRVNIALNPTPLPSLCHRTRTHHSLSLSLPSHSHPTHATPRLRCPKDRPAGCDEVIGRIPGVVHTPGSLGARRREGRRWESWDPSQQRSPKRPRAVLTLFFCMAPVYEQSPTKSFNCSPAQQEHSKDLKTSPRGHLNCGHQPSLKG